MLGQDRSCEIACCDNFSLRTVIECRQPPIITRIENLEIGMEIGMSDGATNYLVLICRFNII